ncbi:hypothetical protein E2562_001021 [Oryza meyeriana var. granulata]|uniref:Uncharacterized protein n=1 Tax=Oryza meyeriana var. granulata TaxID=110450 RepID=A0A6G1EDY2_9ORYZ|nr:hypothetical protein E2562_001021 [Oryza meyeriana var. granulata]
MASTRHSRTATPCTPSCSATMERDISMHAAFRAELRDLLSTNFSRLPLPRVFVDGSTTSVVLMRCTRTTRPASLPALYQMSSPKDQLLT